ncbi:hypothetical protein NDN08_002551 [Rhodosorus marinus]|uniref:Presenilin n=1 Tax=Rhodosorus marinus TaxID=101924 RepID=A0AAV8UU17_9RHOD|nr:hypothetical protein NDN08_002551 [Rhodosorus marinus]
MQGRSLQNVVGEMLSTHSQRVKCIAQRALELLCEVFCGLYEILICVKRVHGPYHAMLEPEQLTRVIYPVVICMGLALYLHWSVYPPEAGSHSRGGRTAFQSLEQGPPDLTASIALIASFVFFTVLSTYCLVRLYARGRSNLIRYWMALSVALTLGEAGGRTLLLWFQTHRFLMYADAITFHFVLWNFTVGGVVAVFYHAPRFVNQGYLIVISAIVSNVIAGVAGWTIWIILIAFVVWDLYAVLSPSGPLRQIVEIAKSRKEKLPALVYDTSPYRETPRAPKPVTPAQAASSRTVAADASDSEASSLIAIEPEPSTDEIIPEETEEEAAEERRHLQLGLGDFIFYSILVIRSSIAGVVPVVVSFTAILAGLIVTLMIALRGRKPLPALPVSILLGVVSHFLSVVLVNPLVAVGRSRMLFN